MAEKPLCKIEGCGKRADARGWCAAHYMAWHRHGDPLANKKERPTKKCAVLGCPSTTKAIYCNAHLHRYRRYGDPTYSPPKVNGGKCKVAGCERHARIKEWCPSHYWRWRNHGNPNGGMTRRGTKAKWLMEHAGYNEEHCLIFPFGVGRYGHVTFGGVKMHAHRAMCILVHGQPPTADHQAAHSCGNGHLACVNPRHLSWKTPAQNQADRLVHGTHCRGERCRTAKLTEEQVLEIRSLRGHVSSKDLSKRFSISPGAVKMIWQRRNWAWLSAETSD